MDGAAAEEKVFGGGGVVQASSFFYLFEASHSQSAQSAANRNAFRLLM